MNFKWKSSQRDNLHPYSSSSTWTSLDHDDLPVNSTYKNPSSSKAWAAVDDFPHTGYHDTVSSPLQRPGSQLITGNIDAFLEEEERKRSSQELERWELRDGRRSRSEPNSSFDSLAGALVGLPAPPRGPRTAAPKRRRSRGTRQGLSGLPVSQKLTPESPSRMSSHSSSSSPRYAYLEPTHIESEVPLGVEVMNALNEGKICSDQYSVTTTAPSSNPVAHSRNRETVDSGLTAVFGKQRSLPSEDDKSTILTAAEGIPSPSPKYASLTSSPDRKSSPAVKANLPQLTIHHSVRPLLAHSHSNSRDSDLSHTTLSSNYPPSTAHEPRISISSTIYPPSGCESLHPPPPVPLLAPEKLQGRESMSTYGDSDHGRFDGTNIPPDVDTPSSAVSETLSIPRFANPDELSSPDVDYSPSDFPFERLDRLSRPLAASSESSLHARRVVKPSLPTAPKPKFRRSRSAQPSSRTSKELPKPPSPTPSPRHTYFTPINITTAFNNQQRHSNTLPTTTNLLNPQERAELVRKSRKLTQMLGQTPSPVHGPGDLPDTPVLNNCLLPIMASRKTHNRTALSVSDAMQYATAIKQVQRSSPLSTEAVEKQLSPMTFRSSFLAQDDNESDAESTSPFQTPSLQSPRSLKDKHGEVTMRGPMVVDAAESFIELDADHIHHGLVRPASIYTLEESVSDMKIFEDERRRKRERLNKLHRFLGSRIPAELVLGPHEMGVPLPPPALDNLDSGEHTNSESEVTTLGKNWLSSRRRASVGTFAPSKSWSDVERMKDNLNDKERTLKVRRAVKMEKMFGEQPPLDLLHSQRSVSLGHAGGNFIDLHPKSAPTSPIGRNINKSSYRKVKGSKRDDRPGTAESSKGLLGSGDRASMTVDMDTLPQMHFKAPVSETYLSYRHSLVSLTNIVNNDDKESLADLHEYMNGRLSRTSSRKEIDNVYHNTRRPSLKNERRRSLPLQPSLTSLASLYLQGEPKAELSPFEIRRRRAAKLSNFFGVSYRDLFGEVLESIETGVREDEGKGTLTPDEVQDLLLQLRKLRQRRDEIS